MKAVRDRRGRLIEPRAHVYVRSGPQRGRSAIVVGFFHGHDSAFVALAFFDRRGERRGATKRQRMRPDDLVRAARCEVVIA
jgi:hypothetical protein